MSQLTKVKETTMNRFNWKKGDKAYITSKGGVVFKIKVMRTDEYEMSYYNQSNEDSDRFGWISPFSRSLKPRGKKTKARYAQWEQEQAEIQDKQNEIKVGDWVEFIEDYTDKCKIGTKVQVEEIDLSYWQPLIRYQVPGGTGGSSSVVSRVKKCEAPDPWKGIEWARGIRTHEYRSTNYLDNRGLSINWKTYAWKPVKLEDLTKEQLIGLINHNKQLMDRS